MIDPEDGTLSGQDTDDRNYEINNDDTPSANFPNDNNQEDFEDNRAQVTDAAEASEAAFTLEAEKGITPDPDILNEQEDSDDDNSRQAEGDKRSN